MEGLPKRCYEDHFTALLRLSTQSHTMPRDYFRGLWGCFDRLWKQVEEENIVAEFWFEDQLVATCVGTTPEMCQWTWNTELLAKHAQDDVGAAWNRVDFIWAKATNNIIWFDSPAVTESSRKILWLCIQLGDHVWQNGKRLTKIN